jgi:HAMP domain-containing protein
MRAARRRADRLRDATMKLPATRPATAPPVRPDRVNWLASRV